jgi:hypothetical protein
VSLISFDVTLNPDPVAVSLVASMTPTQLTLTVQPLDLTITAKPSTGTIVGGAIAGTILGGFVGGGLTVGVIEGVAAAIGKVLTDKVKDAVSSRATQTIGFGAPLGYTIDVQGVKIHVQAATLSLSTYSGMLMADGTVTVS